MTRYAVYLEIGDGGECMAHVIDLPGCTVRAATREDALRRLPEAIQAYHAWLRRHDEAAPSEEERIEITVAEEVTGVAPLDPGDMAALFPPDREPITPTEMERTFRLMGHSRADLLALVRHLPDNVLDRQSDRFPLSIRRLLRHIGNTEEWYTSRLVPPERLPPEWEEDEHLDIWTFLEMERRTALARLRQLTEAERSALLHPTYWTDHPQEAWTARKVLRRFLEHEREHTAQIRAMLTHWRQEMMDRLAAARAYLEEAFAGLDERRLTQPEVLEGWTVQDLLAHIAAWDRWGMEQMEQMVAGAPPDLAMAQDEDAFNRANVTAWRGRPLQDVLAELETARATWVKWMERLPLTEFFHRRLVDGGDWAFPNLLEVYCHHDREHAAQIWAWRQGKQPAEQSR